MMTATQQTSTKTLADLLTDLADGVEASWLSVPVTGLQLDSRQVQPGDVFAACVGELSDGRDYIEQAIAQGAVAVLSDSVDGHEEHQQVAGIPVLTVVHLPQKLSEIAGRFYDHPSRRLPILAVTGTNGKTTCTQLFVQLLNSLSASCGAIGTLGAGVDGELEAGVNTTPDAIAVQRLLAQWSSDSVSAAAMEVSSHGLAMGRVDALQFVAAIFTNLSRDHLDFHHTMQAYGETKAKLFQQSGLQFAIVNADDAFSAELLKTIPSSVKVLDYSTQHNDAAITAHVLSCSSQGVKAELHTPWGQYVVNSPLLGVFNLSNLLAVIAALAVMGYDIERVLAAIACLKPAPGRMELLAHESKVNVVVDYAHTPDALSHALGALRDHCQGQLWCVFGCGGDRDQGKREQMGAVAERLADRCVVTNDNPRGESATAIADQITASMSDQVIVELDRAEAIKLAVTHSQISNFNLIFFFMEN